MKENDGSIHVPSKVVVGDIGVKVKPWCLVLPMSMVDLVNANYWDLWIANSQAIKIINIKNIRAKQQNKTTEINFEK